MVDICTDPIKFNNSRCLTRNEVIKYFSQELVYLKGLTVRYPFFNEVQQQIKTCMETKDVFDSPECMALLGPTRSGKTKILENFADKYPRIEKEDRTEVPVTYCKISSPGERGAIAPDILKALGDPFYNKRSTIANNIDRLCELILDCKVQLIIIDEVQHIVDRDRQKTIRSTADIFKQILDKTRVPIVFAGLKYAENIFLQNEQLNSRVRIRKTASAFEYNNNFRALLENFEMALEKIGIKKSGFSEPDFAKRIYIATGGYIGYVYYLVRESFIRALMVNSNIISYDIMEKAFLYILSDIYVENPFDLSINLEEHLSKRQLEINNSSYGLLSNRRTGVK